MRKNVLIIVLIIFIIIAFLYYTIAQNNFTNIESIHTPTEKPLSMKIKVATLSDPGDDFNQNDLKGCDIVNFVEIEKNYSENPLDVAIKELFSNKDLMGNFISSQTNLYFEKVEVENDIAKIYLTGDIGPLNGVCDNPRLKTQLEQTVLNFPEIKNVEFYLNNIKNDLTFSQE